jgi:hypothetical protein
VCCLRLVSCCCNQAITLIAPEGLGWECSWCHGDVTPTIDALQAVSVGSRDHAADQFVDHLAYPVGLTVSTRYFVAVPPIVSETQETLCLKDCSNPCICS